MIDITRIEALHLDAIEPLVNRSVREGFQFLRRLTDEWISGQNRFDGKGEALFIAKADQQVVAICGLNQDPYTSDESIGRLRHLYTLTSHRRKEIARLLVNHIIKFARPHYRLLRLRTDTVEAASFYARLGFNVAEFPDATHIFVLAGI